jgi:hypothetical protein
MKESKSEPVGNGRSLPLRERSFFEPGGCYAKGGVKVRRVAG